MNCVVTIAVMLLVTGLLTAWKIMIVFTVNCSFLANIFTFSIAESNVFQSLLTIYQVASSANYHTPFTPHYMQLQSPLSMHLT